MLNQTDLSADLMNVLQKAIHKEQRLDTYERSTDKLLEMHNAIMDWACDTEWTDAAAEVMGILDQFVKPKLAAVTIDPVLMTGEMNE